MQINQNLKKEASLIVKDYSLVFEELEKLELMTKNLQAQRDILLNKLEEVRGRERVLIDKLGETNSKITLEEILT